MLLPRRAVSLCIFLFVRVEMSSGLSGKPTLADLVSHSSTRLQASSGLGGDRRRRPVEKLRSPVKDNVPALVAWIVFCKDPVRDQLSLETATRVGASVRLLSSCKERPDIVCFCGGGLEGGPDGFGRRSRGIVGSSALAFSLFRMGAEAQAADISRVKLVVEGLPKARDGVLATAVSLRESIRLRCGRLGQRAIDGAAVDSPPIRVRMISTDSHLQRLADMEELSPRHSPLRPLHDLSVEIAYEHVANPLARDAKADTARQARHIRQSEHIAVVLLNLKGVMERSSSLHHDNARRLSDVRKCLTDDLFSLMPTHGGERALRAPLDRGIGNGYAHGYAYGYAHGHMSGAQSSSTGEMDDGEVGERDGGEREGTCEIECLEVAISNVGKAISLLSPLSNDPLYARLTDDEVSRAIRCLSTAATELQRLDPDRPASPAEWMQVALGG